MHGDRFRKTICPNVVPSPFIACGEDIWQAEPLEVNGGKVEEVMKSSRRGEVDAAFRKKALELLDNTVRPHSHDPRPCPRPSDHAHLSTRALEHWIGSIPHGTGPLDRLALPHSGC